MTRAPFGRRPRRWSRRLPGVATLNWQPCRGGCGARTIDGNPCAPCLVLQASQALADHAVDCRYYVGGECDCNYEGTT